MAEFAHVELPLHHPGVDRAQAVWGALRHGLGRRSGTQLRALGLLVAAGAGAALLIQAGQSAPDTGSDGLFVASSLLVWVLGLGVGLGALRRLAGLGHSLRARLDAWAQRRAAARADQRLWQAALNDPRLMADLQVAMDRDSHTAELGHLISNPAAPQAAALGQVMHSHG